mgnify:FL=1
MGATPRSSRVLEPCWSRPRVTTRGAERAALEIFAPTRRAPLPSAWRTQTSSRSHRIISRCTRAHARRRIHIYKAVRDCDRTGHCVSRSALPAVLIRVSLLFVFFIVDGARFKFDSISFALRAERSIGTILLSSMHASSSSTRFSKYLAGKTSFFCVLTMS